MGEEDHEHLTHLTQGGARYTERIATSDSKLAKHCGRSQGDSIPDRTSISVLPLC